MFYHVAGALSREILKFFQKIFLFQGSFKTRNISFSQPDNRYGVTEKTEDFFMYVIKNALKNLWRNKGRNILLGVIIFVIITATVVALAINNTATAIIDDYKERFASEVVITPDYQNMLQSGGRPAAMPTISPEQYIEFADSVYLAQSVFSATAGATASGFDPVDKDATVNAGGGFPGGGGGGGFANAMNNNIKLLGDVYTGFDDGTRGISEGRYVENDNECLISEALAEENGLTVGSVISLETDMSEEGDGSGIYTYTLTVVGIYYDFSEEYESRLTHPYLNKRNEILTNFGTVVAALDVYSGGSMNLTISATYYLKDPSYLADFEAELRDKGLSDEFVVTTDTATYNQIVQPVVSLKNISLIFMIVVLILGAVIITVLASIAIRERKFEIGTLRAIGMKKSKISLGLLTEILTITIICLVLGFTVGYFVSQPVSDLLLEQQIEAVSDSATTPGSGDFGGAGGLGGGRPSGTSFQGEFISSSARPGATPLSEMEITFDFVTFIEIFGIALALAAIPTVAAAVKITKYEPIKILAERN